MATKFADIAKAPNDLLNDDYTSKNTLKCKKAAGPVAVTIETELGSDGALSSKVGTKFAISKLSFDKLQVKADGGYVLEGSLVTAPGFKVSFKANKGADLIVDYTKGTFCGSGKFDVKDMSAFSTSGSIGLPSGVVFGGSATYSMSTSKISAFNVGTSYTTGPLFAAVTSASKLSQFNIGLLYKVNPDLTVATSTSHSSDKPISLVALGGAYNSPYGKIKAKIGSTGVLSACIVKDIIPKVTATASGSIDASDMSKYTFGVGIVM